MSLARAQAERKGQRKGLYIKEGSKRLTTHIRARDICDIADFRHSGIPSGRCILLPSRPHCSPQFDCSGGRTAGASYFDQDCRPCSTIGKMSGVLGDALHHPRGRLVADRKMHLRRFRHHCFPALLIYRPTASWMLSLAASRRARSFLARSVKLACTFGLTCQATGGRMSA
jgi:hypothetical protein